MDYRALRNNLLEINDETWKRIEVAAEAGDSEAQYLLGSCLYDTRLERDDCEKWLRAAAAQEHPEALYSRYLKSAEQGHQEGQTAGGSMLVRGDGGPANVEEGLALIELATKGPSFKEAQAAALELALHYSGAYGVEPNLEKEAKWREFANRGNTDSHS